MTLTTKQQKALRLFKALTFPRGPTIEEMAHALGLTNRGAHERLRALVKAGALVCHPCRARGLSLTPKGKQLLKERP